MHNRNAWSARQLQRVLARAEYGGCDEPWPAGGALNECRAGGRALRAGGNPTTDKRWVAPHATERLGRDRWAVARELATAESYQGEIGPAHERRV